MLIMVMISFVVFDQGCGHVRMQHLLLDVSPEARIVTLVEAIPKQCLCESVRSMKRGQMDDFGCA